MPQDNALVVLYKGKRGAGKTLSMVKDGKKFDQQGYKVLRNFYCKFGTFIDNEEIIALDEFSELEDAVILIDEIQIFFDSRRSQKKQNVDFSHFVQQIRKRNISILCTTQYTKAIDLRLRQHLDVVAYPKYDKKLEVCEVTYIDVTTLEEEPFTGNVKEPETITIVFNAKPIFPLYDHKEKQVIG